MRPVRALVALLLAARAPRALSGCGSADDRLSELQRRAEQTRHKLEARADRLRRRGRELLASLEQAVPQATPETQSPATRGRTEQNEIEGFLTDVLGSVDRYWTRTLSAAAPPSRASATSGSGPDRRSGPAAARRPTRTPPSTAA